MQDGSEPLLLLYNVSKELQSNSDTRIGQLCRPKDEVVEGMGHFLRVFPLDAFRYCLYRDVSGFHPEFAEHPQRDWA